MKRMMRYPGILLLVGVLVCGAAFSSKHVVSNCYADDAAFCTVTRDGIVVFRADGERFRTCRRMEELATVPWEIDKAITYKYMSQSTAVLEPGKYVGLPYTQFNRDSALTDKDTVQARMTAATQPGGYVRGVDCSSAASYAMRFGTGHAVTGDTFLKVSKGAYTSSAFLFDAMRDEAGDDETANGNTVPYGDFLSKVGTYGNYSEYATKNTTEEIVEKLVDPSCFLYGTIHDNVYAKMKPGDMLVKVKRGGGGHVMMVTGVDLVYSGGLVDPSESKVRVTDQIKPNLRTFEEGENVVSTSWRVNGDKTFGELAEQFFLPVINSDWEDGEMTIEFDANGGQSAPSSQVKSKYEPLKLSSDTPVREGYEFKCWASSRSLVPLTYNPGDYYMEEMNDTLVAQWTKIPSDAPGVVSGGAGSSASQGKANGTVATKPTADVTKPTTNKHQLKGTTIKSIKSLKKGFRVKWRSREKSKVTGYQIRYSRNPAMKKARIVTIAGKKALKKTVRKLKSRKKYYVQVRVFKTVSGVKHYSGWSPKKRVRTH